MAEERQTNEDLFDIDFGSGSGEEGIQVGNEGPIEDTTEDNKKPSDDDEGKKDDKDKELEKELIEIQEASQEENDTTQDPAGGDDSSPVTPFASLLHERGLLSSFDEEEFKKAEDPVEALTSSIQKEIDKAKESYINSFPEELRDLAEAVNKGVPLDEIRDTKAQQLRLESLTEDSLEQEDIQKEVLNNYFTSKGFSEDKINKLIERSEDAGELREDAVDAVEELKQLKAEEQKKIVAEHEARQAEMEKRHKDHIENIKKKVFDSEEIIPGLPVNDKTKEHVYNKMTKVVDKDEAGNPMNEITKLRHKDPIKFDTTLAYLLEVTDGFSDWSKFSNTAESKATKEFKEKLHSTTTPNISGGKSKQAKQSREEQQEFEQLLKSLDEL